MLFCYRVVETELESHFLITEQMLVREALKKDSYLFCGDPPTQIGLAISIFSKSA